MKNIQNRSTRWLIMALAALFLLAAAPCVYAEDAPDMQEMEVTAKRLNVRHYPEVDDLPVVTKLKRGDRVTLLGISGKWSYVKWDNGGYDEQGYVFSRHIKPTGALLYFATDEVNVRSEANSSSRILGVLQAGEAVTFIKKAKGWVQVEYNGANGFVYGKYLTKNRAKSYLGSRLAQELGRNNIKDVEYMYGGRVGIHGLQNSSDKPILAVTYRLKVSYKENAMYVTVYEYATEAEAAQVRRAVIAQEGTPGWHTVYFQKGNTVCTLDWNYWERTTDKEKQLYQDAFETLSALYGEFIPKK